MSQKLSLKLLKTIITGAKGPLTYDQIVEKLDKDQVSYNELSLQGFIQDSLDKGNFVQTEGDQIVGGVFGPKPRQSTGGGTPTRMYALKNPLKPDAEKADFQDKPYDKETVDNEPLWCTTQLAAVKAAKSHFYNTVYWPALEQFRQMEDTLNPPKAESPQESDDSEEEGEGEAA